MRAKTPEPLKRLLPAPSFQLFKPHPIQQSIMWKACRKKAPTPESYSPSPVDNSTSPPVIPSEILLRKRLPSKISSTRTMRYNLLNKGVPQSATSPQRYPEKVSKLTASKTLAIQYLSEAEADTSDPSEIGENSETELTQAIKCYRAPALRGQKPLGGEKQANGDEPAPWFLPQGARIGEFMEIVMPTNWDQGTQEILAMPPRVGFGPWHKAVGWTTRHPMTPENLAHPLLHPALPMQIPGWCGNPTGKPHHMQKLGDDLAVLAKSLQRLSSLLERVCGELKSEEIHRLEVAIGHRWRVEGMIIFVEGFLLGLGVDVGRRTNVLFGL